MKPGWSLRKRLVGLFILAAVLAWALSAAWLAREARREADILFDASLVETAHVVLAFAVHEAAERGGSGDEILELAHVPHAHVEHLFYQVRSPRGEISVYSPGAPAAPLADAAERGLADHLIDGAGWRVYSLADPRSGLTIHVGEPAARREALAHSALLRLAIPGAFLVLLLALAAWWVSGWVVKPVERTARRIDALSPGENPALAAAELPSEVEPLAHALERLQQRVQQALLLERTLTADAAHELRTPLAALRAQAQLAQRTASEEERLAALSATVQAADRCTRLADAVLTLARLDASAFDPGRAAPVALREVAELVVREAGAAANARGVTLEIVGDSLEMKADPDALAVLLRNLVDNALRHANRRVRVELAGGETVLIAVRDDGEGVPEEARERLFDRFYRAPGTDTAGSGIGLALVKRVAELHGGTAAVGGGLDGRGLGIEVRLPSDPAPRRIRNAPSTPA